MSKAREPYPGVKIYGDAEIYVGEGALVCSKSEFEAALEEIAKDQRIIALNSAMRQGATLGNMSSGGKCLILRISDKEYERLKK